MENKPHSREKKVGEGSVNARRERQVNTGAPVGGSSQSGRPGPKPGASQRQVNTGAPFGRGSQNGRPGPKPGAPQRGVGQRGEVGAPPRRSGAAKAAASAGLFALIPKKLRLPLLLAVVAYLVFSGMRGGSTELQSPAVTALPAVTAAPSYTLTPQNDVEPVDGANMMFSSDDYYGNWADLFGSLFGYGESFSGSNPTGGSSGSGGLLQDLPGTQTTPKPSATPKPTQKPKATPKPSASPKPTAAPTPVTATVRDKRVTPLGGGRDTVTVMVYMCGTDLESRYGMATSDLSEMAKANLSDKVNLIVETGGCRSWKNNVVSNSANQIYRVHGGGLERLEKNFGSAAMTDPANLSKFIRYCAEKYPADRYCLILWDHGGGSISGYGYDEKVGSNVSMTLPQIDKALGDAGVVFDWIGYDACLMSTLETALVSAKYADYLIASEEVEPGTGWYYTEWLNALSKNTSLSTEKLGKSIVDSYVSACRTKSYNAQVTLALTDLARLEGVIPAAFRDFSVATNDLIGSNGYRQVSNARAGARQFAVSTRINQVDLADLALRMGTAEGKALAEAIQSCVLYNGTTITKCYGLSIYFPYETMNSVSSAINTYNTLGLDEEYTKVIKSFASLEYGGQVGSSATQGSYNGSGGWDSLFGGGSTSSGSLLDILLGGGSSSYGSGYGSAYGSSPYGGSSPSGSLSGSYTNGYGQSSAGYSISMSDLYDLFSAFGGRSMPKELDWVDAGLIADNAGQLAAGFLDPGRIAVTFKDGRPVLSLTDEEWALVQTAELNIFADDGKGWLDLGLDNVFGFDGNDLLLDYDGTWLTLNGQLVAYYLVSDSENPDGSWTTVGRIPALLNGELVNLQVLFNDENPYGVVTGAYPFYENGETETAPKGLVPLRDGDKLEFLCDYYGYDGAYQSSWTLGTGLTVSGELTLENLTLENKAIPSCRITDIYGNHYWLSF